MTHTDRPPRTFATGAEFAAYGQGWRDGSVMEWLWTRGDEEAFEEMQRAIFGERRLPGQPDAGPRLVADDEGTP
jgi:hypothetical protein